MKNEHDASDIDDEPHDIQLNAMKYQDIDQLVKVVILKFNNSINK